MGRFEDALTLLAKAGDVQPRNFDVHYNLGKVLLGLKRFDDALASCDRALDLAADNENIYNDRGIILKELKRYEDSLESCDRAIALKPDFAEAYYNRGNALGSLSRYEDAITAYGQAISLKPDYADAYYKRGLALQYLKRYEDALANFDRVISLEPDYVDAFDSRGVSLASLGRVEDGVASLRQAVSIDPSNARLHFNLGQALVIQGKVEEGAVSYEQALKIDPDRSLVHTNLGSALAALGRIDEALASYYQALKLEPDAKTYFCLHSLLLDPADISPAIQCLEAAKKLEPWNKDYNLFLGMLLEYAGRSESAADYLKEVHQGSNLDKARLDAWNYIKSANKKIPRMIGSSIEAFRLGMDAALPSGLVLEFGVRFGVTIRQIAGLTAQQVYGFDSFEGIPEDWHDEAKGSYTTNGLLPEVPDNVLLYKGWFEYTLPKFVKEHKDRVRFMNIDCDLYSSTKTILDCLAPQILPGTVIVFDEYIGNLNWRDDEFKAFQEAVGSYGWNYEYLAFSMLTKQVVVRIL